MQTMGYWMNDPLYLFAMEETESSSYCKQDLNQAYRRIEELSKEADESRSLMLRYKTTTANAKELLSGAQLLLDDALDYGEGQHKGLVIWRRAALPIAIGAAIIGAVSGIYISQAL